MKYKNFLLLSWIIVFLITGLAHSENAEENEHTLLGIAWDDSRLVSFDPYVGLLTEVHAQLNPTEAFRGLAYDTNHNILYALAQVTNNLYSIDRASLDIVHIGNLQIDKCVSGGVDAGALTYDPISDTLYTALEHWDSGIWSELCEVDVTNGKLTTIGIIPDVYIVSLQFDEQDGYLYGLSVSGSGSWDSPFKSHVVRINPDTAEMAVLFETPYHTMMGFAKKPVENSYILLMDKLDFTFLRGDQPR